MPEMREYQQFLKVAAKRREEIRKLALTIPIRQIAGRFNLSVQRIYQIVRAKQ